MKQNRPYRFLPYLSGKRIPDATYSSLLLLAIVALFWCTQCTSSSPKASTLPFHATQWQTQEGNTYPFRPAMADSVLYSEALRQLDSTALIQQLGPPDRTENGHLYYLIEEEKLGWFTLSASYIVIKLAEDGSVAWIKRHGK